MSNANTPTIPPGAVLNADLSNPYTFKQCAKSEQIGELVAAVCSVMAKLNAIPKTPAKAQSGKGLPYEYLSEDAITATLRPLLAEAGLAPFPLGGQVVEREDYTAGSSQMTRVLARQRFLIAHKSGQWVECETWGEAADSGDKVANKVMTAAYKYFERQTFCINGGTDPDTSHSDDVARTGRGYGSDPRQAGGNQNRGNAGAGNQSRGSAQGGNQNRGQGANPNAAAGGGNQPDPKFPGGKGSDDRAGKCIGAIDKATDHAAVKGIIDTARGIDWTDDQRNRIRRAAAARRVSFWTAAIEAAPDLESVNVIQTEAGPALAAFPELAQLVTVKARQRSQAITAAQEAAETVPDPASGTGLDGDAPFGDTPVSEMEF